MAKTPNESRTKATSRKKTSRKKVSKASSRGSSSRSRGSDDAEDDAASGSGGGANGRHLVIVESPAKAKTINRYLGSGYLVKASVGHVRDLPERAPKGDKSPVPGVDIEHDFEPTYEVLSGKAKTVSELKRAAMGASRSASLSARPR